MSQSVLFPILTISYILEILLIYSYVEWPQNKLFSSLVIILCLRGWNLCSFHTNPSCVCSLCPALDLFSHASCLWTVCRGCCLFSCLSGQKVLSLLDITQTSMPEAASALIEFINGLRGLDRNTPWGRWLHAGFFVTWSCGGGQATTESLFPPQSFWAVGCLAQCLALLISII